MWLWVMDTTKEKVPARTKRLQVIVAGVRRAFGEDSQVVARGKNTVYEWTMAESEYQCFIPAAASAGQEPAKEPLNFEQTCRKALRRCHAPERYRPDGAFDLVVRAFEAQEALARKDLDVALLVSDLRDAIDTQVSPETETVVARARQVVHDEAYTYRHSSARTRRWTRCSRDTGSSLGNRSRCSPIITTPSERPGHA